MKSMNYLLGVIVIVVICSCGSKKKMTEQPSVPAGGDVEVIVPCSGTEFMTNGEYFRANAMGISNSMEIASQKALTAARSKLAAIIETTIKTVTDNYLSSYEMGQQEEAKGRFQSITREVVNQTLNGVRVICQKTMKSPEGQYKTYVAVELSEEGIAKAISNRVSKDDKLRIDFEYEKFKKEFDAEMNNVAKEQ